MQFDTCTKPPAAPCFLYRMRQAVSNQRLVRGGKRTSTYLICFVLNWGLPNDRIERKEFLRSDPNPFGLGKGKSLEIERFQGFYGRGGKPEPPPPGYEPRSDWTSRSIESFAPFLLGVGILFSPVCSIGSAQSIPRMGQAKTSSSKNS